MTYKIYSARENGTGRERQIAISDEAFQDAIELEQEQAQEEERDARKVTEQDWFPPAYHGYIEELGEVEIIDNADILLSHFEVYYE